MKKIQKILVVEDDIAMRGIVTHKLASVGYEVKQAEDGAKALAVFESQKPDLVLLDLMLPELDGLKVLETIRKNPNAELAATPVIVLSNLWSNQDIARTQMLKADAYMVKAYFTTEEILKKIEEIAAKRK